MKLSSALPAFNTSQTLCLSTEILVFGSIAQTTLKCLAHLGGVSDRFLIFFNKKWRKVAAVIVSVVVAVIVVIAAVVVAAAVAVRACGPS